MLYLRLLEIFEEMKESFAKAALTRFGSGWFGYSKE